MAGTAPNYHEHEEFWKPPVASGEESQQSCPFCGVECVPGSRFCHVCGTNRHAVLGARLRRGLRASLLHAWFYFNAMRDALDQTTSSMAALIAGCFCLVAAVVTGFFFSATRLADWQAVQLWRIEWLLAAIALMTAGVVLKKK